MICPIDFQINIKELVLCYRVSGRFYGKKKKKGYRLYLLSKIPENQQNMKMRKKPYLYKINKKKKKRKL